MKSFFVFENKDAGRAFVDALERAGYERVRKLDKADFILYDIESVGRRRQMKADFLRNRPGFIYPHTPNTCYIWDGIYEPLPVSVNFVAGDGAKECMQAYGYPYRVETCGFPRCEVLPFQFSKPRNLLFVPARPRRDKGRQASLDLEAFMWIIRNYHGHFESVMICRLEGQFQDEFDRMALNWEKLKVITTNPKATTSPAQDMIDRIDNADLVIAQHTPAALAVARGKPTIMYGQGESLENLQGHKAVNYPKYKDIYDYPLDLFQMDIQEVLNFAFFGCRKVEDWKQAHIGGNFDADKFLSIVREYL